MKTFKQVREELNEAKKVKAELDPMSGEDRGKLLDLADESSSISVESEGPPGGVVVSGSELSIATFKKEAQNRNIEFELVSRNESAMSASGRGGHIDNKKKKYNDYKEWEADAKKVAKSVNPGALGTGISKKFDSSNKVVKDKHNRIVAEWKTNDEEGWIFNQFL